MKQKPSSQSNRSVWLWAMTFTNLCVIAFVLFFISGQQQIVITPSSPLVNHADINAVDISPVVDVEALNPYGQAIARAGLQHCAQPMNDLSTRLLAGKQVGLYRFPVTSENFTSLSVEVSADGGATIYMTFNLSQTPDGACHIAYEAVSDWENKCEDVVKTIFKDFVPTRNLMKTVALLGHPTNPNRKIFTMPVNKGCIAIEKEVVFTDNAL